MVTECKSEWGINFAFIIMNKYIVTLAFTVFGLTLSAQEFQGKAEYFSKIIRKSRVKEVKSKEDEELDKIFQDALKKATENKYILTFNKRECLYEKNQELEKPETNSVEMSLSISLSSEGRKYLNLKDKIAIVEDDIFDKEYIKVDELNFFDWKLVNETKKIGDYNCFKAETIIRVTEIEKNAYQDFLKRQGEKKTSGFFDMSEPKDKVVTAWYAPEIPVSFGPNNYYGLPGLILEVDEEKSITLCTKVTINNKETSKIKVPNNGKKVTTAQFNKIRKDKSDSMKDKDGNIIYTEEK